MAALNFKKQFVPHIVSGRKQHTIRTKRVRQIRPGETLYLYTGMRTKSCKQIMQAKCTKLENILITPGHVISVDGNYLDEDECESLARADGFESFSEMMSFWDGRLPFLAEIIHWRTVGSDKHA